MRSSISVHCQSLLIATRDARPLARKYALDEKPLWYKAFSVTPLSDGVYDVLVVDAQRNQEKNAVVLELVLVAGPHKGDVVHVRMSNADDDALSLLGLPGVLTVADGVPSFQLE